MVSKSARWVRRMREAAGLALRYVTGSAKDQEDRLGWFGRGYEISLNSLMDSPLQNLANQLDIDLPEEDDREIVPVTEPQTQMATRVTNEPPSNNPLQKVQDKDFNMARDMLVELAEQGKKTFEAASDLASQLSDSPRAHEVAGQLLKHTSDIILQLIELHEKAEKMSSNKTSQSDLQQTPGTTNNIVMVGTTADLLKMIQSHRKEKKAV